MLKTLKRQDSFFDFKSSDLKDYVKFKNIIIELQKFYKLEKYLIREIDIFLWLYGKELFKK